MKFKSYLGKTFVIESSKAIIRNEQLEAQRYKAGDVIPEGKNVGDLKTIPQRTEINVLDVKTDPDRHTYVLASANGSAQALGWTAATNLEGGFKNETAGLAPGTWQLEPSGRNKTCIDANALIRDGAPGFNSRGTTIPMKSFVAVTETSSNGEFVRCSHLTIVQNAMQVGEEIGWTKASNLSDGCSDLFFAPAWSDQKGANACWREGRFIGAKVLVNIVGFGAEMEQITLDSLDAYLKLKDAAEQDNIHISINSAFRTFARQAQLRHLFDIGQGNNAARPGFSNHQHGQAFDLNTHHNVFNGSDKVYEWLKRNGPRLGFIRTVSKESWHWEFLPAQAPALAAAGKFKLPHVNDA